MVALYDALPDSARSKREDPTEPAWGTTEELLAQLVEEVSVLVADKRRKDVRTIPRPFDKKKKAASRPESGLVTTENGGMVATGVAGLLAAAQVRGAVKLGD